MTLHCLPLVFTCLPLVSQYTLDECFGPHDFALVSQLSPATLDSLPAWFQACLPLVSQSTLDAVVRMISHLSPTAVSHYTLGSLPAWFCTCLPPVYTCLPLLPTPQVVLHCLRYHHYHQPPSTNHHLQPWLVQTSNTMKLDRSTNKLFGVNAGIIFFGSFFLKQTSAWSCGDASIETLCQTVLRELHPFITTFCIIDDTAQYQQVYHMY